MPGEKGGEPFSKPHGWPENSRLWELRYKIVQVPQVINWHESYEFIFYDVFLNCRNLYLIKIRYFEN